MFKPGRSGNPEGRPAGSKGKTQTEIKEAYQTLVEGNLNNIETWLHEVATKDPGRAIELMLRLSEFILPKIKSVEISGADGTALMSPFAELMRRASQKNDD